MLDSERVAKVNHITSTISEMISERSIDDLEDFLSSMSSVICQLDTDVAIEVMKNFGKEGEYQAMAIKVNYGY